MDFYVWITFIVFEANVVFRAMLLDQVHLKDERFKFRADHDPFDVHNVAHEAARLRVVT